MIIFIGVVYSFISNDDYHKSFDKLKIIRYDCTIINEGWATEVPFEVIDACHKTDERYVNVKTYKE